MRKVIDISPVVRQLRGDGEPPDNDGMHTRVTKLETLAEKTDARLHIIEKDVAYIRQKQDEFAKHYATKADLTDAKNSIIVWVVGAIFLTQSLPLVTAFIKQAFP